MAGGQGVPQNLQAGAAWYCLAAEHGSADAQYMLGLLFSSGLGVPQDDAKAALWFRKAAEQGSSNAQVELGGMYYTGRGVSQDQSQAATWFRKAAEQGNPKAQFSLGACYRFGMGVPQDDAQAAAWYQKAADQGNLAAQAGLGYLYAKGLGVPQNDAQAAAWYRKAAMQGDAASQASIGYLYSQGNGVPQDYAQAIAWYRKAANQGNADAQFGLGASYGLGLGVPQNFAEAYFWFDIAAAGTLDIFKSGDLPKLRDHAGALLSSAVLLQVQERARKWFEAHPVPERAEVDAPPMPQPPAAAPVSPSLASPVEEAQKPQSATKPYFSTPGSAQDAIEQAIHNANRHPDGGGENSVSESGPLNIGSVEILTDTQGVNFQPYISRIQREIYQQWLPLTPEEARQPLSKQGETLIRFSILSDGTIGAIHLDGSTHDSAMDRAAWGSITGVGQFPPLPRQFTGPNLELRIHYLVNKTTE